MPEDGESSKVFWFAFALLRVLGGAFSWGGCDPFYGWVLTDLFLGSSLAKTPLSKLLVHVPLARALQRSRVHQVGRVAQMLEGLVEPGL